MECLGAGAGPGSWPCTLGTVLWVSLLLHEVRLSVELLELRLPRLLRDLAVVLVSYPLSSPLSRAVSRGAASRSCAADCCRECRRAFLWAGRGQGSPATRQGHTQGRSHGPPVPGVTNRHKTVTQLLMKVDCVYNIVQNIPVVGVLLMVLTLLRLLRLLLTLDRLRPAVTGGVAPGAWLPEPGGVAAAAPPPPRSVRSHVA